jgi:two-component system, chemotaxis family, sensor kinase CheA
MSIRKSSTVAAPSTILLVDDNRNGLAARRTLMEELGHTVLTAVNGVDALGVWERAQSEGQAVDLLITDWQMPKMDGVALVAEMRSRSFAAPVILMSGYPEISQMREDQVGVDAIVLKTATEVQALLSTVKRLLTRKPARKPVGSQTSAQTAAKATKLKSAK